MINTVKVREGDTMFESPSAKEHVRELNAFVVGVNPVFYDVVYVGAASS